MELSPKIESRTRFNSSSLTSQHYENIASDFRTRLHIQSNGTRDSTQRKYSRSNNSPKNPGSEFYSKFLFFVILTFWGFFYLFITFVSGNDGRLLVTTSRLPQRSLYRL